jgi:UrcA family protein
MNTRTLPLATLASITVAIHLLGFAAVGVGAQKLGAQAVTYRDLDLSRPADAAVLYARIGHAAKEVCAPFDSAAANARNLRDKCIEQAIAATVARLNDANVTAQYHAAYTVRIAANGAARSI